MVAARALQGPPRFLPYAQCSPGPIGAAAAGDGALSPLAASLEADAFFQWGNARHSVVFILLISREQGLPVGMQAVGWVGCALLL